MMGDDGGKRGDRDNRDNRGDVHDSSDGNDWGNGDDGKDGNRDDGENGVTDDEDDGNGDERVSEVTRMMATLLTLHMEEGTCCVLPSAVSCPALIVPHVGRLDSTKTQCPTLNHSLWWQSTCRDMDCHHPCSLCPPTRSRCPLAPAGTYRATQGWAGGCR